MTTELIDKEIEGYQKSLVVLEAKHNNLQQEVVNNQNYYQKIKGAIEALSALKQKLNGSTP
jgi:hypothetical protein